MGPWGRLEEANLQVKAKGIIPLIPLILAYELLLHNQLYLMPI